MRFRVLRAHGGLSRKVSGKLLEVQRGLPNRQNQQPRHRYHDAVAPDESGDVFAVRAHFLGALAGLGSGGGDAGAGRRRVAWGGPAVHAAAAILHGWAFAGAAGTGLGPPRVKPVGRLRGVRRWGRLGGCRCGGGRGLVDDSICSWYVLIST